MSWDPFLRKSTKKKKKRDHDGIFENGKIVGIDLFDLIIQPIVEIKLIIHYIK